MKTQTNRLGACLILLFVILSAGCAVAPAGSYYSVANNPTPPDTPSSIEIGATDQYYVLQISDHTPFDVHQLPRTSDMLYNKGYDEVRKQKKADFSIDVALSMSVRDNPDVRAGNMLGGALFGAAAGAIIGGAAGDPGAGAAIGAASGGALGLAAPAGTGMVTIDINTYSYSERLGSRMSRTIDLATVPPPEVRQVIDHEVSRMLQSLPRR